MPTDTKQRPLNICHVITRMIVGGAQENTLLTVRGLMNSGHRVVLLSGFSPGPEGELLANVEVPGLDLVIEPTLVRELRPWTDVRAFRALLAYFRGNRFDVVHTHSSKAGILGRLAARKANVPLVIHTVHGQAFHPYQSWWRNRLYIMAERLAARSSDRILAVAQAMIEQCVAAGVAPREKYRVVYSGMEMEAFLQAKPDGALRAQLGIPADVPVVGKIARLSELKGHEYLIQAAPAIVREFPEVRFLLVGDGELRGRIEREIGARGLSGHFVFTGLVPPTAVPKYTALMHMLVHLSLREGLPRTVVQALASGIPAIGFDLDGTPEVIHHGETGYVCPPGRVEAVSNAVLALLRDPEARRRMGANGRNLVRERFAWQTMARIIEAQYLDGLAARQAADSRRS